MEQSWASCFKLIEVTYSSRHKFVMYLWEEWQQKPYRHTAGLEKTGHFHSRLKCLCELKTMKRIENWFDGGLSLLLNERDRFNWNRQFKLIDWCWLNIENLGRIYWRSCHFYRKKYRRSSITTQICNQVNFYSGAI